MSYKPNIQKNKMIFNLQKPIYGSFYGIWDKWLKVAKERKLKLVIKFNEGIVVFNSVKDYLDGAKKLERYYKNPNEPMIFYGRDLLPDIEKQKKQKEADTEPLIDFNAKKKLLEVWRKINTS